MKAASAFMMGVFIGAGAMCFLPDAWAKREEKS